MSTLENYFEEAFDIGEDLVREYAMRNKRKKEDEAWLKKNGGHIKDIMIRAEKDKKDVGAYRIAVSIPDESKFDEDKVLVYLSNRLSEDELGLATKVALDEEGLENLIENGVVDLEDLKAYAWVESKGSPRLRITETKKE